MVFRSIVTGPPPSPGTEVRGYPALVTGTWVFSPRGQSNGPSGCKMSLCLCLSPFVAHTEVPAERYRMVQNGTEKRGSSTRSRSGFHPDSMGVRAGRRVYHRVLDRADRRLGRSACITSAGVAKTSESPGLGEDARAGGRRPVEEVVGRAKGPERKAGGLRKLLAHVARLGGDHLLLRGAGRPHRLNANVDGESTRAAP